MNLFWWEKTVEYTFVLQLANAGKLFVAPLDGNHERAGDAIVVSGNRWVLIEFKKDADSLSTEKAKFVRYQQAIDALSERDSHHHIVYGQESKDSIERLQLCSQTYFSGIGCDPTEILGSGAEFKEFKQYVEDYTKFKKGVKGGIGGGSLSMDEFTFVAGVNADNNIVNCLSLTAFQRELGLEILHEKSLDRGRGGISR